MTVKKSEKPIVGEDGYYYFTHNKGAKYALSTSAGVTFYEILECVYRDEKQYFVVHVYSETLNTTREMPIDRLNYALQSARALSIMDNGEPEELPITKAEVELYYARHVKLRNKRKRESNAKLKDDKDYQKLLAQSKELAPKWAQAICNGSADEKELEEQMQELTRKKREIMDKLGVKFADLTSPETCAECNDKGITSKGNICACAYAKSDKIKAYCSAERLVERRIEEQLNDTQDS